MYQDKYFCAPFYASQVYSETVFSCDNYYDCFNGESTWALPPVLGMLSHAAQDPNHASLKKVQLSAATLINPRNNSELGLNAQFRSLFVFGIPVTWSAITLENACLEALLLPPPGAAGSSMRRSNFQLASAVAPPTAFSTVARNAAAVGTSSSSADPAVATATPASTGKSGKAKAAKAKNKAKAKAKNKAANKASASASSQQQRGVEYSASASQNTTMQEQSKASSSSTFRERSPKREQMLVSKNAGSFSPTNKAFFMNLRNPNPATKKHLKVILQFDDNYQVQ